MHGSGPAPRIIVHQPCHEAVFWLTALIGQHPPPLTSVVLLIDLRFCPCSPSLIYLVVKRPGVGSWHFWASWIILILCVLVTVLGSIGALRGIITAASGFHFYQ